MHVAEPFITAMTAVFRSPYGADKDQQKAALKEYYKTLARYSGATLNETWERVKVRWDKQNWPPIAFIVKTAAEVLGETTVKETRDIDIENALTSPQGQYALENGSSREFLFACKNLGWVVGQELTEKIVKQQRMHCEGMAADRLKAHQDAERELREKYLRKAA